MGVDPVPITMNITFLTLSISLYDSPMDPRRQYCFLHDKILYLFLDIFILRFIETIINQEKGCHCTRKVTARRRGLRTALSTYCSDVRETIVNKTKALHKCGPYHPMDF